MRLPGVASGVLLDNRNPPDATVLGMTPLGREGIKALRESSDVAFFRREQGCKTIDSIRGYGSRNKVIFTLEREAETCQDVREAYYSDQDVRNWRTIVGLLKPNDHLGLFWEAGACDNFYCRGAMGNPDWSPYSDGQGKNDRPFERDRWQGLHADRLLLIVDRPTTTGQPKTLFFLLGVGITPNNSARMIRRHHRRRF